MKNSLEVSALRSLCRGQGLEANLTSVEDSVLRLFACVDSAELYQLIVLATAIMPSSEEKRAIAVALGAGAYESSANTLEERRRIHLEGVTYRTVIRYEIEGARQLAEVMLNLQEHLPKQSSISQQEREELFRLRRRVTALETMISKSVRQLERVLQRDGA